jgi:hypothetical protein
MEVDTKDLDNRKDPKQIYNAKKKKKWLTWIKKIKKEKKKNNIRGPPRG